MLIDGIVVSNKIKREVQKEVSALGFSPTLAVCLVGEDPASAIYVKKKQEACDAVGITSVKATFSNKDSTQEIVNLIKSWNADKHIHGILVQLPLPKCVSQFEVLEAVSPNKDVDAFHSINCGLLVHRRQRFFPCTPAAIIELLKHYEIVTEGKHVTIINRSLVVGQPLALMLLHDHLFANATVTVCHEYTKDIGKICKECDILITAVGKRPKFHVSVDMVHRGQVVIDVGVNRDGKKIIGDVDFDEVRQVVRAITPPVGGVGPVTVACLLRNTLEAARRQNG